MPASPSGYDNTIGFMEEGLGQRGTAGERLAFGFRNVAAEMDKGKKRLFPPLLD